MLRDSRYFSVREEGVVKVVTILLPKIVEDDDIQAMGAELFVFVDDIGSDAKFVINWSRVTFMSAAFFSKIISLQKKLGSRGGRLVFCQLHPAIYETFVITKLNRLFDIKDHESDALLALSS